MEEWAEKFGWKKVVAILIIAALLGFIYVIFSMSEVNKPQTNSQNIPTVGGQSVNSGSGINNSKNSNNGNSSSTNGKPTNYKASQFNISYPSNFTKSEVGNPATKDDIVTLKNPQNVTITLHFYPSTTTASSIYGPFKELGYSEDDFAFDNFSGKIYTGKLGDNPTIWEQLIVFDGENKDGEGVLFGALLDYPSTTRNTDIEQNFQDIVKSFSF